MNRRLYFVLPDVPSAREVMEDLLLARVDAHHQHFLGKRGLDLEDLPAAGIFDKTDVLHGMLVGGLAGAACGALLAIALYSYPALLGIPVSFGIILPLGFVGAVFGAWVAGGLIGTSTANQRLRPFVADFEAGHVLLMLDVPLKRVDELRTLIRRRHPVVADCGMEAMVPAFP